MQKGYAANFSDVITAYATKMLEKIEPLVAIETKKQEITAIRDLKDEIGG